MGGERVFRATESLDYTVPPRFAGSILELEPDTEYECRLTMRDPDGVEGEPVRTVKVRTRGEPKAAPGGRVLHVYPPDSTAESRAPARSWGCGKVTGGPGFRGRPPMSKLLKARYWQGLCN